MSRSPVLRPTGNLLLNVLEQIHGLRRASKPLQQKLLVGFDDQQVLFDPSVQSEASSRRPGPLAKNLDKPVHIPTRTSEPLNLPSERAAPDPTLLSHDRWGQLPVAPTP